MDIDAGPLRDCTWTPIDDTHGYCAVCDPQAQRKCLLVSRRNCVAAGIEVPLSPLIVDSGARLGISSADVVHYAGALIFWAAAGFPVRSPEEVAAIHAEHCGPCEKQVDGRCSVCGCRVASEGMAVANKLAMATEKCPLGKWPTDTR